MKNYYELLGVDPTATREEIEHALLDKIIEDSENIELYAQSLGLGTCWCGFQRRLHSGKQSGCCFPRRVYCKYYEYCGIRCRSFGKSRI